MNTPKKQQVILFDIFTKVLEVDEEIFSHIIEIFRQENISDTIEYLSIQENQRLLQSSMIKFKNSSSADEGYKLEAIEKNIKIILSTLKNIKDNNINLKDFSSELSRKKKVIISKIKENKMIRSFLKSLVHLTAIVKQFIVCGSNSFHLLVEMKADLSNQSWEDIRIKDTSLIGGMFVRCNINRSEFDTVDINGINLNGAQLFNCKWKKIKINGQLNKLDGHTDSVNSVCFSPDGNILASGSDDVLILHYIFNIFIYQLISQIFQHSFFPQHVYKKMQLFFYPFFHFAFIQIFISRKFRNFLQSCILKQPLFIIFSIQFNQSTQQYYDLK